MLLFDFLMDWSCLPNSGHVYCVVFDESFFDDKICFLCVCILFDLSECLLRLCNEFAILFCFLLVLILDIYIYTGNST